MERKARITLGSIIIIILVTFAFIMFLVEGGIIIKTTSNVLNSSLSREYRAWDFVFGLKKGDKQVIENSVWSTVGIILLIVGGLSPLLMPLEAVRFLLGFLALTASSIFTYLLPYNANIRTVDWGNLLTIKPVIGIPVIISLLLQAISALISGYLYISYHDE